MHRNRCGRPIHDAFFHFRSIHVIRNRIHIHKHRLQILSTETSSIKSLYQNSYRAKISYLYTFPTNLRLHVLMFRKHMDILFFLQYTQRMTKAHMFCTMKHKIHHDELLDMTESLKRSRINNLLLLGSYLNKTMSRITISFHTIHPFF